MGDAAQLPLLADHVKLSLLERQRAISLKLEPNSHDGEISKSLDSLETGLIGLESREGNTPESRRLRAQFSALYSQFHGKDAPKPSSLLPNDPSLQVDFTSAQHVPNDAAVRSKSVRFRDNDEDAADAANRAALMPYKDDPDDQDPDHSHLDNQQVHEYHSRVIREQDEQLDRLGESVGRQRHLSMQIGNELDDQVEMLDDLERGVDRQQTALDRARGRLGTIARRAKDNMQLTVIFVLIIILILVIVILE